MNDQNSIADIRARLEAYESTRGYNVLNYPERLSALEAQSALKEHMPADLRFLLDALEDATAEVLQLAVLLREIADLLPERSRLGKDAANFVIEDVGRRARYALSMPLEDDHAESE